MKGWGVLRAASKLLSSYFRHRHAVLPKLASESKMLPPISNDEGKTAITESPKKENIPEANQDGEEEEGKEEKATDRLYEDNTQPPNLRTPRRRWRIARDKLRLITLRRKVATREATTDTAPEKPTYDTQLSPNLKEAVSKKQKDVRWPKLDELLEQVMEKEGLDDMGTQFEALDVLQQQCMLCFSIFKPFSRIRKRTMIYWWIGERFASAEDIGEKLFDDLVKMEFIEPTLYNHCTGVILECTLHPFVHWMLKSKARDASFADLDNRGKTTLPPSRSRHAFLRGNGKPELMPDTPSSNVESTTSRRKFDSVLSFCTKMEAQGEHGSKEVSNYPRQLSVIFNLSSRYYSLEANQFENFKMLVVLQLGRWHRDSKYYIEMEDYTFLSSISHLKKLRYLGLQGMSRLTELPIEIRELQRLVILDLRGCQNLVEMRVEVKYLKRLTRLDLTECYMLEHIPVGLGLLSELQVLKGFVFGGSDKRSRCKLSELSKLKKLRKLSINIATEARIESGEMRSLKKFEKLQNLTITWGQLPTILSQGEGNSKKKDRLLQKWTELDPPPNLEKLDLRCYPKTQLPNWFTGVGKLKKLYVRGGKLQTLLPEGIEVIDSSWNIKILRLKHLDFSMEWEDVGKMLPILERMEISEGVLIRGMEVVYAPYRPVDQNGVWISEKINEAPSGATAAAVPDEVTTSPPTTTVPTSNVPDEPSKAASDCEGEENSTPKPSDGRSSEKSSATAADPTEVTTSPQTTAPEQNPDVPKTSPAPEVTSTLKAPSAKSSTSPTSKVPEQDPDEPSEAASDSEAPTLEAAIAAVPHEATSSSPITAPTSKVRDQDPDVLEKTTSESDPEVNSTSKDPNGQSSTAPTSKVPEQDTDEPSKAASNSEAEEAPTSKAATAAVPREATASPYNQSSETSTGTAVVPGEATTSVSTAPTPTPTKQDLDEPTDALLAPHRELSQEKVPHGYDQSSDMSGEPTSSSSSSTAAPPPVPATPALLITADAIKDAASSLRSDIGSVSESSPTTSAQSDLHDTKPDPLDS